MQFVGSFPLRNQSSLKIAVFGRNGNSRGMKDYELLLYSGLGVSDEWLFYFRPICKDVSPSVPKNTVSKFNSNLVGMSTIWSSKIGLNKQSSVLFLVIA